MFISVKDDGKAGNGKATEISQEKAKFFCFRSCDYNSCSIPSN